MVGLNKIPSGEKSASFKVRCEQFLAFFILNIYLEKRWEFRQIFQIKCHLTNDSLFSRYDINKNRNVFIYPKSICREKNIHILVT